MLGAPTPHSVPASAAGATRVSEAQCAEERKTFCGLLQSFILNGSLLSTHTQNSGIKLCYSSGLQARTL